jgi:hypothetical protein
MKHLVRIVFFVLIVAGLSSCYNTDIKKPNKLIPKRKFVKVMVDMYLAQSIEIDHRTDSIKPKFTQTDLYFSVLKKYKLSDSVFIRSLIYYSSFPKEFEKTQAQIMDILQEKESQFRPSGKLLNQGDGKNEKKKPEKPKK